MLLIQHNRTSSRKHDKASSTHSNSLPGASTLELHELSNSASPIEPIVGVCLLLSTVQGQEPGMLSPARPLPRRVERHAMLNRVGDKTRPAQDSCGCLQVCYRVDEIMRFI